MAAASWSEHRLAPPPRRYPYVADGPAIYVDSFATIRRESDLSRIPADAEKVAVRMIHGSGQTDLVDDLVVHPRLGSRRSRGARGRCADPVRRPDGRDGHHGRPTAGRQRGASATSPTPRSRSWRATWSTTRTAAAVSLWEPHLEGSVVAIGNAPTALFHLLEMLIAGAPRPAAIVGCPVGFIGARESKDALVALAEEHGIDVPYVTVRGRRGGSAMASSAVNALAQEAE